MITPSGTPDSCTIEIVHKTNVKCVRNITHCLTTNGNTDEFGTFNNLNSFTLALQNASNSTFANLSIVYDIIYAKYRFDISITRCSDTGKRFQRQPSKCPIKYFFELTRRKRNLLYKQ